jgi:hypothetical protein
MITRVKRLTVPRNFQVVAPSHMISMLNGPKLLSNSWWEQKSIFHSVWIGPGDSVFV